MLKQCRPSAPYASVHSACLVSWLLAIGRKRIRNQTLLAFIQHSVRAILFLMQAGGKTLLRGSSRSVSRLRNADLS